MGLWALKLWWNCIILTLTFEQIRFIYWSLSRHSPIVNLQKCLPSWAWCHISVIPALGGWGLGIINLRSAWATQQVPDQPGRPCLHLLPPQRKTCPIIYNIHFSTIYWVLCVRNDAELWMSEIKCEMRLDALAHSCNPRYLAGRDQKDHCLIPSQLIKVGQGVHLLSQLCRRHK
jgi:hypothetical protein